MAKFRKLPAEIDAVQWFKNGDHPEDYTSAQMGHLDISGEGRVVRYFRRLDLPGNHVCDACGHTLRVHGWIDTLEGGHIVCPSDWIIKGVEGEFYPCKNTIFRKTYEPADEEAEKLWNK